MLSSSSLWLSQGRGRFGAAGSQDGDGDSQGESLPVPRLSPHRLVWAGGAGCRGVPKARRGCNPGCRALVQALVQTDSLPGPGRGGGLLPSVLTWGTTSASALRVAGAAAPAGTGSPGGPLEGMNQTSEAWLGWVLPLEVAAVGAL